MRATFNHKDSEIVKNTLFKLRNGLINSDWLTPNVRQELKDYWAGAGFKEKSNSG